MINAYRKPAHKITRKNNTRDDIDYNDEYAKELAQFCQEMLKLGETKRQIASLIKGKMEYWYALDFVYRYAHL